MNISRVDLFYKKSLSMNLEFFRKEFQSIILQLIHNSILRFSAALNVSYNLLTIEELRDGITKQPSTHA